MTAMPSSHELIERAKLMKSHLKERAATVEKNRAVSEATIAEFRDAGFFKILQPKAYGGYEMQPAVLTDVIAEVASACGSSGWVLAVLSLHQWEVMLLDDATVAEIWGEDSSILLSSAYAPTGEVKPVDGGFLLSGRWPFSSGCDHAQWAIVGGVRPPRGPGEVPTHCSFFVPRSDYEIVDDWHVMGLAGTGSNSLVMKDVFVPERRHHPIFGAAPPPPEGSSAIYKLPFGLVFVEMLAAAVHGMARGILDQFIERSATRIATMDRSKFSDNPDTHHYIADTDYVIRASRALSHANLSAAFDAVAGNFDQPMIDKARHFWEAAKSVHSCNEVAQQIFANSGAHAIMEGDSLQRAFRDIQSAATHMAFNVNGYARNYGAMVMGHPSVLNLI
ncbi:acyl-CoA dehydrogenase family protein [Novosphingobium sp.]|uniref:acyl-CoA dehydrogenase family protein n=1 Tax=Novosphingobium sp. TaxID=1874826 RepID=UPI002735458B|nr:acyl-CoA dehydrogenase family protein [Novosphingobium sp.]MDP3908694.1 acyl-CoA dehydrogenase family protein [Novosphingobium sp.]